MSMLNDIFDKIVKVQRGLSLTVDGNALPVEKRKLPKREETVDTAYQVTVSGTEMVDECTRIGFGGVWRVLYKIDVTLMTPNDRDQLRNLADHAAWREATRAEYMKGLDLPSVKGVEIIQSPHLARSKLAQGYDYNQVTLLVTTYERRT